MFFYKMLYGDNDFYVRRSNLFLHIDKLIVVFVKTIFQYLLDLFE